MATVYVLNGSLVIYRKENPADTVSVAEDEYVRLDRGSYYFKAATGDSSKYISALEVPEKYSKRG